MRSPICRWPRSWKKPWFGLGYEQAGFKIAHLLRAMRARRMSGVALKDDLDRLLIGG
jgi:hypothetical protein